MSSGIKSIANFLISCYNKFVFILLGGENMEHLEETKIYSAEELQDACIMSTLLEVVSILKERGYNPIYQLVGYLMSGDLGYITSYKNARQKIMQFDRTKILEILVKQCVSK